MKITTLKLNATTPNQWSLNGELTMVSLSANWRQLDKTRPDGKNKPSSKDWQINFAEVKQMDSAGVAFLLDCIRYANAHKIKLLFLNLSDEVLELIEAQGMMSLIQPYLKDPHESK
ncbi:MAG: STAS domain-containing protein [Gammaproteobacteria bacterium]|nr:STAS domain-containing protein [Gammaproteobacteria bacterium]